MAQPAQIFTGAASGTYEFSVVDNSAAASFPTLSAATHLGYDTGVGPIGVAGATAQGLNKFGDTGNVLVDSVNDQARNVYNLATVNGNPVSNAPFAAVTATTVLNSQLSTRLIFKSPA